MQSILCVNAPILPWSWVEYICEHTANPWRGIQTLSPLDENFGYWSLSEWAWIIVSVMKREDTADTIYQCGLFHTLIQIIVMRRDCSHTITYHLNHLMRVLWEKSLFLWIAAICGRIRDCSCFTSALAQSWRNRLMADCPPEHWTPDMLKILDRHFEWSAATVDVYLQRMVCVICVGTTWKSLVVQMMSTKWSSPMYSHIVHAWFFPLLKYCGPCSPELQWITTQVMMQTDVPRWKAIWSIALRAAAAAATAQEEVTLLHSLCLYMNTYWFEGSGGGGSSSSSSSSIGKSFTPAQWIYDAFHHHNDDGKIPSSAAIFLFTNYRDSLPSLDTMPMFFANALYYLDDTQVIQQVMFRSNSSSSKDHVVSWWGIVRQMLWTCTSQARAARARGTKLPLPICIEWMIQQRKKQTPIYSEWQLLLWKCIATGWGDRLETIFTAKDFMEITSNVMTDPQMHKLLFDEKNDGERFLEWEAVMYISCWMEESHKWFSEQHRSMLQFWVPKMHRHVLVSKDVVQSWWHYVLRDLQMPNDLAASLFIDSVKKTIRVDLLDWMEEWILASVTTTTTTTKQKRLANFAPMIDWTNKHDAVCSQFLRRKCYEAMYQVNSNTRLVMADDYLNMVHKVDGTEWVQFMVVDHFSHQRCHHERLFQWMIHHFQTEQDIDFLVDRILCNIRKWVLHFSQNPETLFSAIQWCIRACFHKRQWCEEESRIWTEICKSTFSKPIWPPLLEWMGIIDRLQPVLHQRLGPFYTERGNHCPVCKVELDHSYRYSHRGNSIRTTCQHDICVSCVLHLVYQSCFDCPTCRKKNVLYFYGTSHHTCLI